MFISIFVAFKAMQLDEITMGENADRGKERAEASPRYSHIKGRRGWKEEDTIKGMKMPGKRKRRGWSGSQVKTVYATVTLPCE